MSIVGYRYVGMRIGYGSGGQMSAYDKLKARRSSLGASLGSIQASLNSFTTSLATAQLNKISGLANIAAQAGLSRVQAQQKASAAASVKQIDAAQASLNQAKSSASLLDTTV